MDAKIVAIRYPVNYVCSAAVAYVNAVLPSFAKTKNNLLQLIQLDSHLEYI